MKKIIFVIDFSIVIFLILLFLFSFGIIDTIAGFSILIIIGILKIITGIIYYREPLKTTS